MQLPGCGDLQWIQEILYLMGRQPQMEFQRPKCEFFIFWNFSLSKLIYPYRQDLILWKCEISYAFDTSEDPSFYTLGKVNCLVCDHHVVN
jgi:hypothetical protein